MSKIHNLLSLIMPFRDNSDLVYAAKHREESGLILTGNVHLKHTRGNVVLHDAWEPTHNTFTTEGMNRLLDIIFGTASKAGSAIFYVGLFKNNVTPGLTDTAAAKLGAAGAYGECQDADYSTPATNKPSYVTAAAASSSCTNAASAASFTIAAGASFTAYGAFLGTGAAKTDTTGYLMAAKKFGTARAVIAADVLGVTYVVSCTTS
jgi:hypothetical protein